jgi:glycosyltransferase involved in cell wall biosynthesis
MNRQQSARGARVKPHLVHVFATFAPGGPQVRTARVLCALAGDLRHTIVALDGELGARELLAADVEAAVVDAPVPRGSLAVVGYVRRLLRRTRADQLLTYNWGAIEAVLAGQLERVPVVHHEDGFRADEARGFKRRRVLLRRLLLPGARAVVVPSHRLLAIALDTWRLAPGRVRLVPNGVCLDDFPPRDGNPDLRAALGVPQEAFLVGSVGHLRPEKNPLRLVEAFALLALDPPAHLALVGDGPERAAIRTRARQLGVDERVHLLGHVREAGPCYRALDAFAIPSDTEQLPMALLEAMASALPVVATDVGDLREALPVEGHAGLVPLGDGCAPRLAQALAALAHGPERARELGRQNRARVAEAYAFEAMLARYRELYLGA